MSETLETTNRPAAIQLPTTPSTTQLPTTDLPITTLNTQLTGRVGIEIELLAPRGASRETLANAIAACYQGGVRRYFHPQSEPSKIPGTPILENLTLGFEAIDADGKLLAKCVDDLTLQADCDRKAKPKPGWYRIVSDDVRLLKLVSRVADLAASVADVLTPVAELFGTTCETAPNGMVKVKGEEGPPIAIAAPLPGERERPCEVITPPWQLQDLTKLEELLSLARQLGFSVPVEGATHFHFDAEPLCEARVFKNLVNLLWAYGPYLRQLVGTNARCRRLGSFPAELVSLVRQPEWESLSWETAVQQLQTLKLTKYCDFNLKNLVYAPKHKYTFEARIFPVWLTPEPFYQAIGLMDAVLLRAQASEPLSEQAPQSWSLEGAEQFLADLPLSDGLRTHWRSRVVQLSA
ncbi:MAG: amidoligase family protein [Cyanobacteria bacterium J06635_11]